MFSKADAYERFMGRWSGLLAPKVVAFAEVRDGDVVLDVGSGTGELAFAVRAATETAAITGIDPSAEYVAYAAPVTESVEEAPLIVPLHFTSFDDYWAPFLLGQGPAGAYVASLSKDRQKALRRRLRKRLVGDGPDRAIDLNARAWAVKGTAFRS